MVITWPHFHILQTLFWRIGLKEAAHKASPPAQAMTWLGLQFDTVEMTVTFPSEKLQNTFQLVEDWVSRQAANIHQLQALLGQLLHIAQCCQSTRLFLNCMLATLRECPGDGTIWLSPELKKDLQWFLHNSTACNGVSIIDEDACPGHGHLCGCLYHWLWGCVWKEGIEHHLSPTHTGPGAPHF